MSPSPGPRAKTSSKGHLPSPLRPLKHSPSPPLRGPLKNSSSPPLRGRCRRQRGVSLSHHLSGRWRRTPPLSLRDISPRKGGERGSESFSKTDLPISHLVAGGGGGEGDRELLGPPSPHQRASAGSPWRRGEPSGWPWCSWALWRRNGSCWRRRAVWSCRWSRRWPQRRCRSSPRPGARLRPRHGPPGRCARRSGPGPLRRGGPTGAATAPDAETQALRDLVGRAGSRCWSPSPCDSVTSNSVFLRREHAARGGGGGRASVRAALYMSALVASRHNPVSISACWPGVSPRSRRSPPACCKLLVILNDPQDQYPLSALHQDSCSHSVTSPPARGGEETCEFFEGLRKGAGGRGDCRVQSAGVSIGWSRALPYSCQDAS